jgi:hydroxymethylbilane synthase
VRIATRGSALALAQARWVAERVDGGAELVPLVTTGDRRRAVDDKREWVAELEDALLCGEADALVLAAAGLRRLGREEEIDCLLDLVPAAGQGTLAIEARAGDEAAREAVRGLGDTEAEAALACERALVAALGADCRSAVGAHARPSEPTATLEVEAFVGLPDGSHWVTDGLGGGEPAELGREVARRLLAAGAGELLR